MYPQYGGTLPVYVGTRHQRGGGILSSIARFLIPVAKTMLTETVKATPGVVSNIMNNKQSAKHAILQGLKTAGKNTAQQTLQNLSSNKRKRGVVKKRVAKHRKVVNDVLS